MTKHADPANHLHHVRSAMPKPGQLLTAATTLHSVKPISKPRKADKAMIAPTDAFGTEAMRRRAEDERIAAVDFAKAPITNATVRAPWWHHATPACARAPRTTASTPAWWAASGWPTCHGAVCELRAVAYSRPSVTARD